LALVIDPGRDPEDVFLFKVSEGFGLNEIGPDREFLEATLGAMEALPLEKDQRLHLIVKSPTELRAALEQSSASANEVRDAIRGDDFEILFQDEQGLDMMEWLRD
jgi:hypothetical protein